MLRQVADTLAQLRGREVRDAVMRSDLRQLKTSWRAVRSYRWPPGCGA